MVVIQTVNSAAKQVSISRIIIWNPFVSKALYVGGVDTIPKPLYNRVVTSYRYDKDKERLIVRVQA